MAGQHVVPVEQIPKGESIIISQLLENQGAGLQVDSNALFLNNTGKRLVIHRASLRAGILSTGANAARISRRANGSATAVNVSSDLATHGAGGAVVNTLLDFTLVKSNGVPSQNIVEPGELVSLDTDAIDVALDSVQVTLVLTETVY